MVGCPIISFIGIGVTPSIAEAGLHEMFDEGHWLLMPEDNIIQQYFANLTFTGGIYYADRKNFPDIPVYFLIINRIRLSD